jgi:hypothetical protein
MPMTAELPGATRWEWVLEQRRHADRRGLAIAREAGEALRNGRTPSEGGQEFLKRREQWREERGPLLPADLRTAMAIMRKGVRTTD